MSAPVKCVFLGILLSLLWITCPSAASAAEFTRDFRGRSYDPKQFRPTGSNLHRVTQADAEGWRITLPANHVNKLPVGIVPRFGVRGDFEITLAFDILRVDRPTAGNGAGVSIYITMVSPTREAATLGRLVRRGGEHVFFSHRATTPEGGNREHHGGRPLVTDASSGRLRLTRTGSLLSYQVAQGESNVFREVYQTEFGTADLDLVRFAADNGGSPTVVDVRIKSVSIRSDELGSPRREPPEADDWSLWIVAGVVIVLLAAGGYGLHWRSRRLAA
ncbi:MAG TPA: DUF1583 domain-containing protein [Gemmataceae bacterium]|nr:DUF1583 domain-containing protein [Gemmataceae bacterium]